MGKIKFKILDSHTIELLENATKGDIIDLLNAESVDLTKILERINLEKDNLYQEKINQEKEIINLEYSKKLEEFKNKYNEEKQKLLNDKILEIQKLKLEKEQLKNTYEEKIVEKEEKTKLVFENKIKDLELKSTNEKNNLHSLLLQKEQKLLNIEIDYKNQLTEQKLKNGFEVEKLTEELENLKREKSIKNIKIIGEELENYCLTEFNNVSTYGFKTSTFEKDNISIKNEGETKGTKGDFIFKVYAEEQKKNLLLSVMCEMKSEQLNSENKKKNQDHYKKLNDDRNKKNLDYALLVSELEYNTNDGLVYRVQEYENMFVVRPAYFITMLGVMETIALKYKELTLNKIKEELTFKEKQEILDSFNDFKNNLLDNAIKHIETNIEEIKKSASVIQKEADKILEKVNKIVETHLTTVKNKIENFKIESLVRKIEKNNGQ